MTYATRLLERPSAGANGRCVLVIDGDADLRVALRLPLDIAGWTVWEAPTAAAARRAMEIGGPGVIVLGSTLSDGDIFSLLAELKSDLTTSEIPVVVLTSSTEEGKRAMSYGAFDYVPPGFSGIELQQRLVAALRSSRAA